MLSASPFPSLGAMPAGDRTAERALRDEIRAAIGRLLDER